ncbi:MAG: universal stress protein [Mucilaginibacter sp.]
MGSILILTDFSAGSLRAAEWALLLARKARLNLHIFHSYVDVPVIPYDQYPEPEILVRIDEELHKRLNEFADSLREVAKSTRNEFEPKIQTQLGEGGLGQHVKELVSKHQIVLTVMGATEKTKLENLLMGNQIGSVIEHATGPVLIVPLHSQPISVDRVTLAIDFDHQDITAVTGLAALAGVFDFKIEAVHVQLSTAAATKNEELTFIKTLKRDGITLENCYTVRGKSVLPRLYRECRERGSAWLAVIHHQHGVLRRLFYDSTTRTALDNLDIPLLIVPSQETQ